VGSASPHPHRLQDGYCSSKLHILYSCVEKQKEEEQLRELSCVSLFLLRRKISPRSSPEHIPLFLIGQNRVTYVMCCRLVHSAPSHKPSLESLLNCRGWGSKTCISQPPCM